MQFCNDYYIFSFCQSHFKFKHSSMYNVLDALGNVNTKNYLIVFLALETTTNAKDLADGKFRGGELQYKAKD